MKAAWALLLGAALAGQGCATIMGGGQPFLDVEVTDAPPGTAATLRGVNNDIEVQELGLPVHRFALDRGSSYALGVSAPGHKPELVIIKQQLSPYALAELAAIAVGAVSALVGVSSSQGLFTTTGAALVAAGGGGLLVDEITLNFLTFDHQHVVIKLEPR